ncbi:hypothetical protein TSOC_008318 [Tetrabaena socialis]|uniref:Protein kinase domain-containing protein n=1 Tax=Tetrabaena socialis TaxID=47790 RepID=A0A2J7ZYR0_9CHLO|nr:hypothetical protein TSOC_008318 [Tetrabaena socialis]|eukprot:PNH05413.1 hypothetical protein TSOC_008318 [Tetrabaena socialis]
MGMLKRFMTLMKGGNERDCAETAVPDGALDINQRTVQRKTTQPLEQAFSGQGGGSGRGWRLSQAGPPQPLAGAPARETFAVTTTSTSGSRLEATTSKNSGAGSRLLLQCVKAPKTDAGGDSSEYDKNRASVPGYRASGSGLAARTSAAGAPGTLPPANAASPVNPASGTANIPCRRQPNRVASLPLLLDSSPKCTVRRLGSEEVPLPECAGSQAEQRLRRPPRRADSLKYLLSLDKYSFNPDVSVQPAREAACDEATPEGVLEGIISASGTSTSILAVSPALPPKMRRLRWGLADYWLLKRLHKGYASDVFQARCKVSGEEVVLKVYKLAGQDDIQRMQLYREVKLHAELMHSRVLQYYACFLVGGWVHGWHGWLSGGIGAR